MALVEKQHSLSLSVESAKYSQTEKILRKYSTNVDLINHCFAVSAGLKHFANIFGEDENLWAEIGILHGLAYEMFYDKKNQTCYEILKKKNLPTNKFTRF